MKTTFSIDELYRHAESIAGRLNREPEYDENMICFIIIARKKYGAMWPMIVKGAKEKFKDAPSKSTIVRLYRKYSTDPAYLKKCKLK